MVRSRKAIVAACATVVLSANVAGAAVLNVTNGLVTRLESNMVSLSGSSVTTWTDQSGEGNHATGGVSPLYVSNATPTGAAAVDFDGTQFLNIGSSGDFEGTARSWYVVFQADAFGNTRPINSAYTSINSYTGTNRLSSWGTLVNNGQYRSQGRASDGTFVAVNVPSTTGVLTTGTFYVGGSTWDSATGTITGTVLDPNGTTYTGSGTGANGTPIGHVVTRIGAGVNTSNPNSPATAFNGQLAAVLVYNRVLSSSEEAQVMSYLSETYIPEPASLSLLALGATVALRRRRAPVR